MRPLFVIPLVLAFTAVACSSRTDVSEEAAQTPGTIAWESCGSMECGALLVPLDYSDPNGERTELALIRFKARDEDKRIGVLLANPGGPGASANEFVEIWRSIVASDIRNSFDIVAFDPRGVGDSSPIDCHETLQELVAADPDPDTDAEWEEAKAVSKEFADDCAEKYASFLPHMGTKNVARDMDAVRAALGEEKLNYVGYSYGTSIGAVYADMFPDRIRAMVLDGGTDLSLEFEEVNLTQMVGFERAFDAYLADCKAKNCSIAKGGDPRNTVNSIFADAEDSPIPAPDADRPAGPGEVELGIISALYSKSTWSSLTKALDQASKGDGTGLVDLTDQYLGRESNGDYPNLIEANSAVNYVDEDCPKDPEAYRAMGEEFAKTAPTFGESAATAGLMCAYWSAPTDPVATPSGKGAPPIIVIATTNDPATPYEWGQALSEQLESGVLVTHRGEGHTIYAQGNACIDDVVNAYLLTMAVPVAGTTCGNGPPPPAQQAGPTPTTSATATKGTPTTSPGTGATDTPATHTPAPAPATPTPSAPSSGGGDDDDDVPWVPLAVVLLAGTAAAVGVVWFVGRRR